MKKFLQFFLSFLLLLLGIYIYLNYFKSQSLSKKPKLNENLVEENVSENNNNLIKNLKYNVKFNDNTEYVIISDLSELTYQDESEVVLMRKVVAKFIDNNLNTFLTITADNAIYNNSTYNTLFEKNVRVQYMDNTILSEKLDINFKENLITVYDNIVYDGKEGRVKADNMIINLITKNVEIFMNNSKDKVKIKSR